MDLCPSCNRKEKLSFLRQEAAKLREWLKTHYQDKLNELEAQIARLEKEGES